MYTLKKISNRDILDFQKSFSSAPTWLNLFFSEFSRWDIKEQYKI